RESTGFVALFFTAPFCVRKLCAIFVGRIDILRAVGNLAVNGRTLFAPTKNLYYYRFLSIHLCRGAEQFFCVGDGALDVPPLSFVSITNCFVH
ncbi:hypothetical protein, partial [Ruminococcus sp.]|uniref:hypothetical protein n=1 Tax=Ruminococcus sp. TaxID=41978 RepID=UPI003967B564